MAELPPELSPMQPPMQEQPTDGFRQQIAPLTEGGGAAGAGRAATVQHLLRGHRHEHCGCQCSRRAHPMLRQLLPQALPEPVAAWIRPNRRSGGVGSSAGWHGQHYQVHRAQVPDVQNRPGCSRAHPWAVHTRRSREAEVLLTRRRYFVLHHAVIVCIRTLSPPCINNFPNVPCTARTASRIAQEQFLEPPKLPSKK